MRPSLAIAALFVTATPGLAQPMPSEADLRDRLCAGMRMEVRNSAGTADCIDSAHVIEIDWADKWKEGIGQALAYGVATGITPGLVLVCRQDEAACLNARYGAEQTLSAIGLPFTLWLCRVEDETLESCARLEFGRQ